MTSLGRRPAGNPFEIRRSWIEEEKESRGEKRTSKLSVQKTILVLVLKMAMDVCLESKEQREREREGLRSGFFLLFVVCYQ